MALRFVAAHAEHDRPLRGHPAEIVAEAARFLRASGRVVFRIEVEDDFLATEVSQRHLTSVVRGQCEVGRAITYRQHCCTGSTHASARFNVTDSSARGPQGPSPSQILSRSVFLNVSIV